MEKITVFLADWQVLFREGIHFTLSGEEDMEVIGEDVTNQQALTFIETNPPQVAVLNANHEKMSGIRAAQHLRQNLPEVAVILVLDTYNEEHLYHALKSGASACLTKDVDPDTVVASIRQAAQGGQPISDALLKPEIAARILHEAEAISSLGEPLGKLMARLTKREEEILRHVAEEKTLEQTAEALGVTEEYIRTRLQSMHRKLVDNDQKIRLIQAVQSLPAIARVSLNGGPSSDYLTKEEFGAFKESLMERFRSFSGE